MWIVFYDIKDFEFIYDYNAMMIILSKRVFTEGKHADIIIEERWCLRFPLKNIGKGKYMDCSKASSAISWSL